MASSVILFLVVAWWSFLDSFPCTAEGVGFSISLFHRDSSLSPFYNASEGPSARTRKAVRRSNARADYLRSTAAAVTLASDDDVSISSKLIPVEQEYFMAFSLGTPPVQILAFPDTGSDLVWTQCKPCKKCYHQDSPLFDPRSPPPTAPHLQLRCLHRDRGHLRPQEGLGPRIGDLHLRLGDGENKVSFPNIAFGCAHQSGGLFNRRGAGLVGLSRGTNSLVQQLGPAIDGRFSYCLVPPSQKDSSSHLNFGDTAVVSGPGVVDLPMLSDHGPYDYYLSLEEIIVGDAKVPVRRTPSPEDPNVVILVDSGTTLTYLRPSVVDQIKTLIAGRVHLTRMKDPDREFELCYLFRGSADEAVIPDIVFGFKGGSWTLKASNTFVPIENGAKCLGILSSQEVDGDAIFGSWAQQNFHVGYDLKRSTISFAPADCSKL
ncbi:unnamed protein product [Spirodela intermedia]|uniref:Peptidase A1 domain-containing protein n=1 Tax=Spirodela intermedia TaxID=51605 RepID=A0A7I8JIE0_SPIIN|nr:unnamed protein product [Spirodela intermedia]CAA6669505.1 unnamed protein product [Spirodela intermedia]